jgi:hypothetical protein
MLIFSEENKPSRELFIFLKYNKILTEGQVEKLKAEGKQILTESDELLYADFVKKFSLIQAQLDDDDDSAKVTSSALFSMFGFNRHYCSMTGQPIIGKYYKIGGKIVSRAAYEAHKILQEIEKKEEQKVMPTAEELARQYSEDKGDE